MFVMYLYHTKIVKGSVIFMLIHTFQEALEKRFEITISLNMHAVDLKIS
jgi:hypothetical protein